MLALGARDASSAEDASAVGVPNDARLELARRTAAASRKLDDMVAAQRAARQANGLQQHVMPESRKLACRTGW